MNNRRYACSLALSCLASTVPVLAQDNAVSREISVFRSVPAPDTTVAETREISAFRSQPAADPTNHVSREISALWFFDCNLNGNPDTCDIIEGISFDDDGDGIPDECVDFCGGCTPNNNWSCFANWDIADDCGGGTVYPDNSLFMGDGPFNVVLDSINVDGKPADEAILDVDVSINTLALLNQSILSVVDGDLTVTGDSPMGEPASVHLEGKLLIDDGRVIDIQGPGSLLTFGSGGFYGSVEPLPAMNDGTLFVDQISIGENFCIDGVLPGAAIQLTGGMQIFTDAWDIDGDGDDDVDPDPGCCPPIVRIGDDALAEVGDLAVDGPADILVDSTVPVVLNGNFTNESTTPEFFDWDSGGVVSGREVPQQYEVAGSDIGPTAEGLVNNFAVGTFTFANGTDVTLVDLFDNDQMGQGPCTEALYVDSLVLENGATITLDNCNVYYNTLNDQGALINFVGCATLQQIVIVDPPESIADCADTDRNGIRDDNCVFWSIVDGVCVGSGIPFGDMGGPFGACPFDGTADGNDRFHALNCFGNSDPNGLPGDPYPCEDIPVVMNVDTGGQFGSCEPDGTCDGNDAFAALNAFGGTSSCMCPLDGGPAPDALGPIDLGRATLTLRPSTTRIKPGAEVQIEVWLGTPLPDLRGYQLHVEVSNGRHRQLELIDIAIDRPPALAKVFKPADVSAQPVDAPSWTVFNRTIHQMLAGTDGPGQAVRPGYMATFTYRASHDAGGRFRVELMHDHTDPTHRSFLFPTPARGRIELTAKPVVIEVERPAR